MIKVTDTFTVSFYLKVSVTFISLILLAGCSSTDAIYKNYDAMVKPGQSVNSAQAKIIAQKQLINTEDKDSYRVSYPDIKVGALADKYPDYWFVVFGHNWLEPLSNDALEDTYTQLKETEYVVVITKKTGEIVFFGEWFPKRENDFDWVFDRHAYNSKDPLTLPPYKPSKVILLTVTLLNNSSSPNVFIGDPITRRFLC